MKKIDLVAIDIDGTLVNSKKEITPCREKGSVRCQKSR
jgi:hydroxymethylpyrimidine pyrophosphatase-like HAD family hydrolase